MNGRLASASIEVVVLAVAVHAESVHCGSLQLNALKELVRPMLFFGGAVGTKAPRVRAIGIGRRAAA